MCAEIGIHIYIHLDCKGIEGKSEVYVFQINSRVD